jgi:hypothetical protein
LPASGSRSRGLRGLTGPIEAREIDSARNRTPALVAPIPLQQMIALRKNASRELSHPAPLLIEQRRLVFPPRLELRSVHYRSAQLSPVLVDYVGSRRVSTTTGPGSRTRRPPFVSLTHIHGNT